MVAETTIAIVFAVLGVVTTVVWLMLAGVGVLKLDQLRRVIGDETAAEAAVQDETAGGATVESDPLETLRDRYARGELSDDEFERKLQRLVETEDGVTRERVREQE